MKFFLLFPWGESSWLESWSVNEICGWGTLYTLARLWTVVVEGLIFFDGSSVLCLPWWCRSFSLLVVQHFLLLCLLSSCCICQKVQRGDRGDVVFYFSALSCHPFLENQQPTKSSKWRWMIAFQPSLFPGFMSVSVCVCVGNLISSSFLSLSL